MEESTQHQPTNAYTVSPEMRARLIKDYTYHEPKTGQPDRYITIRDAAHQLARLIVMSTPPGREQALALTALEPVVFYANAAIARNE